jgi:putative protease
VAAVVSVYRRAIDRYYSDPDRFSVSEDEIGELREAFSRGFTEGYLSGIRDERMMSFERPSDRGVFIGRVTYLDIYKARLGIELKTELHIGDEVEAWVSQGGRIKIKAKDIFVDGKKVEFAPAGSKAAIAVSEKRHKIHSGDRVFRVRSDKLERKAREIIKGSEFRRVPIAMEAEIAIGKPITIVARTIDERNSHKSLEARAKSDFIVEVGERRSLSEADAIAQFERLGNTVYRVDLWNITVEPGAMVSLGKLNELRRAVIDKLDAVRIGTAARQRISVKQATAFLNDAMQTRTKARKKNQNKKPVIAVDVSSFKQAERAAINGADWIYLRPGLSRFDLAGSSAVDLAETVSKLKSAYGVKAALSTGNIIHDKELDIVGSIIKSTGTIFDALLVDNFGIIEMMESIKREKDASLSIPLFVDYHMNIFNRLCAGFFETNTASRICLSTELTLEQTADIVASISSSKSHIESEAIVHGWLEVMTAEHCVPSVSKHSCTVCKTRSFIAEDQKGFKFPIEQDENCRSHIYNSHELYLLPNIRNIINTGVSSLRLMLNRYTPDDAGRATSLYREAVDLIWSGSKNLDTILERAEKVLPGLRQTTTGHYFRAVQ